MFKINTRPVKKNGKAASKNNIHGHDIARYIHRSVPDNKSNNKKTQHKKLRKMSFLLN